MDCRPDTIAAVATAPGRGGIGVVRVSGVLARDIAVAIAGRVPTPRYATFCAFRGEGGTVLDKGVALFFPAPHSFSGEDVLELQGHGGPVVLREILRRCITLGARLAQPGEFTRRAFLNERMDLAQAEAVADLIDASSAEAARGAARSLSGEFSRRVHWLTEALLELRLNVEACIDFPEEEIDPANHELQRLRLTAIRGSLAGLFDDAKQGSILREGMTVVLAGRPNVGKSSLLNRLAGEDVAIVTPVAGTTRDFVRATIHLDGVPIHLIDTAGLREPGDEVEQQGIARAWEAIGKAGAVMLITDLPVDEDREEAGILSRLPSGIPIVQVMNKIDLHGMDAGRENQGPSARIRLSAKSGLGVDDLRDWLLEVAGWRPHGEGLFLARERHLQCLEAAAGNLAKAENDAQSLDLFAEELRLAQRHLGKITGEVTADDLLGEIFSRFCIGK